MHSIFNKVILNNDVSCEFDDDEFRVDTHLCKLRCWYLYCINIYMIILFFGDSVRSFFSSRPQYAILGTGTLGQIVSFERRLRGAAQTLLALPYPFRTWPGSGTWAERDKREVRKF